jgi:hypothetical protein
MAQTRRRLDGTFEPDAGPRVLLRILRLLVAVLYQREEPRPLAHWREAVPVPRLRPQLQANWPHDDALAVGSRRGTLIWDANYSRSLILIQRCASWTPGLLIQRLPNFLIRLVYGNIEVIEPRFSFLPSGGLTLIVGTQKWGFFLQSIEATPCGNLLKWKLTPENPWGHYVHGRHGHGSPVKNRWRFSKLSKKKIRNFDPHF